MTINVCAECERIEQNCTYTAETHHIIAARQKTWYTTFQLVPAVAAAIMGTLAAGKGVPGWVAMAALLSAVVSAIGTVMNPQQGYYEHLNAAKAFTVLKHDARAQYEIFASILTPAELVVGVKSLHDRYNDLIRMSPPTDNKAFEEARKRVQSGIHKPDDPKN